MFSENFFFTVTFDGAGVAYLEGLIWPKMILIYNEDKSEKSFFGGQEGEIREQFIAFIEVSHGVQHYVDFVCLFIPCPIFIFIRANI